MVAAVIAWVLASQTFDLPQPFLAPWAALLVVHATVYRTFSRGLKQVSGAVLGVLLAWAVGNVWGLTNFAVAALLAAGLLVGAVRWFRDESTAVAATGLIVLTTGFSTQDQVLLDRLYDTAIGIAVGLVVNLLVWPPMRDLSAARAIGAIGDKVGDAAARHGGAAALGLRRGAGRRVGEPHSRARRRDRRCVGAAAAGQGERPAQPAPGSADGARPRTSSRGCCATTSRRSRRRAAWLARSATASTAWSSGSRHFRERWVDLLQTAGEAITAPDAERVSQVRAELHALADELSDRELSGRHWPEYGALIMNLRNVVTSMDGGGPPPPARAAPLRTPRATRTPRPLIRG